MKKLIIIILLTPSLLFSQTKDELDLCMAIQGNGFISNAAAQNALNRILNTIGASKNFVLTPCDKISNAVATAYKGTRYILYDNEFMNLINRNTNDWSNLFILAHEVGHHINGHSIDVLLYTSDIVEPKSLAKKREQELEADEFAAFVLAKLGASLSQLNSIVSLISDNSDDTYSTHPKRSKRLASVKIGFNKGYVKKETKTIFVDSKNLEYDKDENYTKNGAWYTKIKEDIFEATEIESITVGEIAGDLDNYIKIPNLLYKISVKDKSEKRYSFGQLMLDANWEDIFPDIGNGKEVNATIIVLGANKQKYTYSDRKLVSKIGNKVVIDDYINQERYDLLKSGNSILIRFDGYTTGDSEDEIYKKLLYERYKQIEIKTGLRNNFNKDEFLKWYKDFWKRCWKIIFDYSDGKKDCSEYFYKSLCGSCSRDKNWKLFLGIKGDIQHSPGRYYFKEEEKIKNISKSKAASSSYKNLKGSYFQYSLSGSSKALSF